MPITSSDVMSAIAAIVSIGVGVERTLAALRHRPGAEPAAGQPLAGPAGVAALPPHAQEWNGPPVTRREFDELHDEVRDNRETMIQIGNGIARIEGGLAEARSARSRRPNGA